MAHLQTEQHLTRAIFCHVHHGGRQDVEHAGQFWLLQRHAHIARLNTNAYLGTRRQRRGAGLRQHQVSAVKLQLAHQIRRGVTAHVRCDQRRRPITMGQRQIQAGHEIDDRAVLPHLTLLHQHHMVCQPRQLVRGVRHIQHRNIQLRMKLLQPGQDVGLALGIQRGQGLIHEQDARAAGQRTRNGHSLALSARKLMRHALQQVCNAKQVQALVPGVAALGHGGTMEAKLQVVLHAQVVEQAGFLEHIAHSTLVRRPEHAAGCVVPDIAIHRDSPRGAALQACQHAQACGFATSRRAEQNAHTLGWQLHIHIKSKASALQLNTHLQRLAR